MIKIFKQEVQRLFPILEAIKEGKTIQFHEYFQSNGDINEQKAALFLNNLEIKPIGENNVE